MIFWIFVILAIGGLVTLIAFRGTSKEDEEFKRLEEEYEYESQKTVWTPLDLKMEAYNRQLERKNAAYDRLQEFKKARPYREEKARRRESISNIGGGFLIGAAVVVVIMLIALIIIHIDASSEFARKQAEYEALSWEVSNDIYAADDDVLGRKELYNQVREWNKNVAGKKAKTNNFWVGIFVPDYYNNLQLIELK